MRHTNKGKDFTAWVITGPEMESKSYRLSVEGALVDSFRREDIELTNTAANEVETKNTFTHGNWKSGVVLKSKDGKSASMLSTKDCNHIERALRGALFGSGSRAFVERAVKACEKFERFEEDYSEVGQRRYEEAGQFLANCEDMYFKAIEAGIYSPTS